MKISQRLKTLIQASDRFWKKAFDEENAYPETVVDLVIFHKLHFHMTPESAWKCFSQLQAEFVDWNEVRISVVREIQEQLAGANDSLELAVFIKDFLEFVHKERRRLTLEPLIEENLTDIRRFFKPVRGLDSATVEFVLMRTKQHPVVPLSAEMERCLSECGIVKTADSRDRKAKHLFEVVGAENALPLHHYVLYHSHASSRDGADKLPAPLASGRSSRSKAKKGRAAGTTSTRKVVRKPVTSKQVRRGASTKETAKKSAAKKTPAKRTAAKKTGGKKGAK